METLKQQPIWICWNLKTVKGKKAKVPCASSGGVTGTTREYSHTWVTYDEAVTAMKKHGYTGVGFIIPEGVFFIDKDHIDLNDPIVQKLLKTFPTYAERSFSGDGVHSYGLCDLSRIPVKDGKLNPDIYYTKNPHNGTEVYIGSLTSRFAAFTGEVVQELPLVDCTDALLELLEEDMRKDKYSKPVEEKPADLIEEVIDEDDPRIEDIIAALRWDRNAPKFVRLFDEGDITGYGSHSEADAALCAIIAFRAGPNPALIDAIFRRSELYRDDKWERADYENLKKNIPLCIFSHRVITSPSMPAIDSGKPPILFGDFKHFVIGDRKHRRIKRLTEVHAQQGQVAYIMSQRVDAKLLDRNAIAALKVK